MTDDMDPGELQTVREYLGLTTESLAGMLNVRHDTVRKWESGRFPVPDRVREEVETIEEYTARAVDEVTAKLMDSPEPAVRVYRTDAEMHAARPDLAHLPARWWRHVVYRAADVVPGTAILSRDPEAVTDDGLTFPQITAAQDLAMEWARGVTPDGEPIDVKVERRTCNLCEGATHRMAVAYHGRRTDARRGQLCVCPRHRDIAQGNIPSDAA